MSRCRLTAVLLALPLFTAARAENLFAPYLNDEPPKIVEVMSKEVTGAIEVTHFRYLNRVDPKTGREVIIYSVMARPTAPGPHPAVLVCHGGGGSGVMVTPQVIGWAKRGYVSICQDQPGICSVKDAKSTGPVLEGRSAFSFDESPIETSLYDGVAAALNGLRLLRSAPDVDKSRVGVTGGSWGGYMTTMIAGLAGDRVKASFSVYGCGFYPETNMAGSVNAQGAEGSARWLRWWDPSVYLPRAKLPMLWVTGSNDFAFWFPGLQKSYRAAPGPRTLAVRVRMPHGHGASGEAPKEIQVFADSLLRGGPALAAVRETGRDGDRVWATFTSPVPVVRAELNYTLDDTPRWPDRQWETVPAQLNGDRAEAVLPDGVKVWYLNLVDNRDCVVSTEHVTAP